MDTLEDKQVPNIIFEVAKPNDFIFQHYPGREEQQLVLQVNIPNASEYNESSFQCPIVRDSTRKKQIKMGRFGTLTQGATRCGVEGAKLIESVLLRTCFVEKGDTVARRKGVTKRLELD